MSRDDELLKKMEALDAELVRLLNERARLTRELSRIREAGGGELYEPAREKAVLDRVTTLNPGPLPGGAVQAIYREILSASLALEKILVVAYLGPPATFTHQAARLQFGAGVQYAACETIGEVFAAVVKKTADYGVVPIENSTDGAVTHTLDQFTDTPLKICAEIYLPISHSLLSRSPRDKIRRLYSKPEVFGQCRRWLHENLPGVELISASSTARAAETAAKESESGALASTFAAELYGLDVLEQDVQDQGGNTTRFLVIGKAYGKPTGNDKTSVFFGVKHKVGALHDALSAFKKYGINMTKIESRPSKTKAWEYYFFVDFEGHAEDPHVQKALTELEEHCTVLTVLGAYPKTVGTES